jgi:hypothetical protein
MKIKHGFIFVLAALLVVIGIAHNAKAEVINFDDQGLSGPSLFVNASPSPQHLNITTSIGTVMFDGGVILTNTSNLPANQTSIYGTADFGTSLSNPLTVTFPQNITNFFLDVYNGETFDVDYKVYDNAGHSATFSLANNLSSGTTQIGFAATGDIVYVEAISGLPSWDFFIDNIHFDEALPPDLVVPLPGALLLLGSGLAALIAARRKFNL